MDSAFKTCSFCSKSWKTRLDFLQDQNVEMIGYQPDFDDLDFGLFYFNHNQDNCGTTLSLPVTWFKDMYDGVIYTERITGQEDCPGHCLYKDNLEACPAHCSCAYVRALIQIVKTVAKTA